MSAGADKYARRSFTISRDADAVLEQLHQRTGRSRSQLVSLALLALQGNFDLAGQSIALPLMRLHQAAQLLGAMHPDDIDIHASIREQLTAIQAVLAPPKIARGDHGRIQSFLMER